MRVEESTSSSSFFFQKRREEEGAVRGREEEGAVRGREEEGAVRGVLLSLFSLFSAPPSGFARSQNALARKKIFAKITVCVRFESVGDVCAA